MTFFRVFMIFYFSYAGIIRIRFMGYNLSPMVLAPPKEKYRYKINKSENTKDKKINFSSDSISLYFAVTLPQICTS